jgi:AcrR family transcriptional regulator
MMPRKRKPGRPPKRPDTVSPKERLLRSAQELFYQKGMATGVDELSAHAKVAKPSLYAHFGSKENLATEYVVDAEREFREWFEEELAHGPADPKARLLHSFDILDTWVHRPNFRGCRFINAALQLGDPAHPASLAALAQKTAMRARLEELCYAAGLRKPKALARVLSLLIDGALVASAMEQSSAPAIAARNAAIKLVEASSDRKPRRALAG